MASAFFTDTLNPDESMTEHFTCPICTYYMEQKIILCSNGHSLCQKCAVKLTRCPFCATKLNLNQRNLSLENAATKFKKWAAKRQFFGNKNNAPSSGNFQVKIKFCLGDGTSEQLVGNLAPKANVEVKTRYSVEGAARRQQVGNNSKASFDENSRPNRKCIPGEATQRQIIANAHYTALSGNAQEKSRSSFGTPVPPRVPAEKDHFGCPVSKCCYFANCLLNLKIHIQTWHSEKIHQVGHRTSSQPSRSKSVYVKLNWRSNCPFSMHLLTDNNVLFVIYVSTKEYNAQNPLYYINVLVISDKSIMYKFTCGNKSHFCAFYTFEGFKPEDGIVIDKNDVEELGLNKITAMILIKEVAQLNGNDDAKNLAVIRGKRRP